MGYFTTPKTYSFLQGLSWELLLCSNQLPNLRVCRNQTKCLLSSPSYQPIKTSNKTCVQALQPCHPAVLPRNLCQVAPAAFKIPSCSNKLPAALLPTAQLWLLPTIVLPSCCPAAASRPTPGAAALPIPWPVALQAACLYQTFLLPLLPTRILYSCCTKIRTIPAAPILRTRPLQQNQNQETAQLLPLIPIFPCPALLPVHHVHHVHPHPQ